MQITVFNGSPRKENGVTHLMTEQFLAGAQKASAETDYIFLEKKKIHPCFTKAVKRLLKIKDFQMSLYLN